MTDVTATFAHGEHANLIRLSPEGRVTHRTPVVVTEYRGQGIYSALDTFTRDRWSVRADRLEKVDTELFEARIRKIRRDAR